MSIDRRTSSVKKLLERYISDCQKERSHNDGLLRLDERMDGADFSTKVLQVTTRHICLLFSAHFSPS